MLPSKWPSCVCIQYFKDFKGILSEISLLQKYMEKIDFSNLLSEKIEINTFHCMYFISIDRPENFYVVYITCKRN